MTVHGRPRRSKFNARRTVWQGIHFDSLAECRRYRVLVALEQAGQISQLTPHPRFRLDVHGIHVCDYLADAAYVTQTGERVVEDVKGLRRAAAYQLFRLKAKLLWACQGIRVQEVS